MKEKEYLLQFIPTEYMYLTKIKKIKYQGVNLKTDLLINLINELYTKYYFAKDDLIEKELDFNIWSVILKKKYGAFYNYYMDFLTYRGMITIKSDYYRNKKARTYKLNLDRMLYPVRVKVYDKVLLKKNTKDYQTNTFISNSTSPIPKLIRKKLIDDLYSFDIDAEPAKVYLNELLKNNEISFNKYQKNLMSIDNIDIKLLFFKPDEYGRFHTNFTILKKDIRHKFITNNNEELYENDLSNSQPLFLGVLMKKILPIKDFIDPEITRYCNLVKNGVIYDELINNGFVAKRSEAKIMMYKVLFGENNDKSKYNRLFKSIFPKVYQFIKDYKISKKSYKALSHTLQKLESEFIFNNVIQHLMNSYPEIPVITVHDSICYPIRYKDKVEEIFNYYCRKLL